MLNDAHEDHHLRHLLDHRSARADVHGRYPSISEYSDSPSVYSPAFFSPRLSNHADDDQPSPSHRPFNGSRLNDPNTSMLDLDDDPRSSFQLRTLMMTTTPRMRTEKIMSLAPASVI